MGLSPASSQGGGGAGTVTSVTAADASVVVGGTAAAPTIATAPLNTIAALHAATGAVDLASHKLTSVSNGTTASDGATFGQLPGALLGSVQATSNVAITSTTEATGTTILALPAITFDGNPVELQFNAASVGVPGATSTLNFVIFSLFEGATEIAKIGTISLTDLTTTQAFQAPIFSTFPFTPTAGVHTYTITAFSNSATGATVFAGAGGTTTYMPANARVKRV